MKLIGCGLIIILTARIGAYFSASLDKRRKMLKTVGYMLEDIAAMLRYKSATVYEILEGLAENERFSELTFIKAALKNAEPLTPFGETWEAAVNSSPCSALLKSDLRLLKAIGKNLGKSDCEGQLSILCLEKEELRILTESAENDYSSKAKLYRMLGLLSGAFIVICIF